MMNLFDLAAGHAAGWWSPNRGAAGHPLFDGANLDFFIWVDNRGKMKLIIKYYFIIAERPRWTALPA
jgi:hypothetical protein